MKRRQGRKEDGKDEEEKRAKMNGTTMRMSMRRKISKFIFELTLSIDIV